MQSQRQNHTSRMFVFSAVYEIGLSSMCACQQNLGIHEDKFKKNLRKIKLSQLYVLYTTML